MKYAVVRKFEEDGIDPYINHKAKTFSVYHETLDLARQEAERLCKKEGKPFNILKIVGQVELASMPIKYTELG